MDLKAIRQRYDEHYSRGTGEPVGLPRHVWMRDTLDMLEALEKQQQRSTYPTPEEEFIDSIRHAVRQGASESYLGAIVESSLAHMDLRKKHGE